MLREVGRAFAGEDALSERQGSILVLGAGAVFSCTAIVYRAVDSATDWQFLAYRGGSTVVAMLALIIARRRSRPVRLRGSTWKTVAAGLMLAATSLLYILALERTSAATTLFLLAAAPVASAILGWALLRERVHTNTVIAIVATAIGISIMVGTGLGSGSRLGLLLAAMIPLLLGFYNVTMRADGLADPVVPALLAGAFLAVTAGVVAAVQTGLDVSWRDAGLASISGGVALGLGLPMFNLGLRVVPAARVSLLLMTEVVLAPLWVWIWPGERPPLGTLIGGAIVLASVVWLVTRVSEQEELLVA